MTFNTRLKAYWPVLLCLLFALIGAGLVLLSTIPYGPGVSGDAVDYLAAADGLMTGKGFLDQRGAWYVHWPPLYPMLLAAGASIGGISLMQAGLAFNVAAYAGFVVLSGLSAQWMFPQHRYWLLVGLLVSCLALPVLRVAANIASDVLFLVLVLVHARLATLVLRHQRRTWIFLLALTAGLAAILRWHGVILVASGVLIVLIARRSQRRVAMLDALWSGVLASLPFLIWVVGRNYLLLGTFLGSRDTPAIDIGHNWADAGQKIIAWFLSRTLLDNLPLLAGILIAGLVLLVVLNWRRPLTGWLDAQLWPVLLPWLITSILYFIFVILTSIAYDHPDWFDDRYYLPLYPALWMGVYWLIEGLVIDPLRGRFRQWNWPQWLVSGGLVAAFMIWGVLPGYRIYRYISINQYQGESTYNLYNTVDAHYSSFLAFLKSRDFSQLPTLYTNDPTAIFFWTGLRSQMAPQDPDFSWLANTSKDQTVSRLQNLARDYTGWPAENVVWLVWFTPNPAQSYFEPDELRNIAIVEELLRTRDGRIFAVHPNP